MAARTQDLDGRRGALARPAYLLLGLILAAIASASERVEILRDEVGVPHIFARTAAGAAFGSGYTQAADRFDQLLKNLRGVSPAAANTSGLSSRVRAIVDAYCAGINAYAGQNVATPAMVEAYSRSAFGEIREANHVLIGSRRSRDDAVIAILEPRGDWYADSRFYEIRVYAPEEGLAFAGAGPVGVPFPLLGHNRSVSIGISGVGLAGENVLEQVWSTITATNLAEVKRAIVMGQLPLQRFMIGTADGEIYDSGAGVRNPQEEILLSNDTPIMREPLGKANTFSFDSALSLAFATDVYQAEAWQNRLARIAPESKFVQLLTGWSRRAQADSRAALAFYLFKTTLGDDASALKPPDHVSDVRIRAALRAAQDRLEIDFPVDAAYGTLFRIGRQGGRRTWPMSGGVLPSAGMITPRAIVFEKHDRLMLARGGQAAVQVVLLSRPVKSASALPFGESDQPGSAHFDDQARELFSQGQTHPSYFGNRKELEKHSKERKVLTFE